MARRANDPNLLRAQAQSGREGADAYQASQQQLQGQQQAAVQAAMQAAALRGAPGAAVAQVGRQVGRPYNQAIGNLGMMGNTFRQDMASRAGRLDDYNQAVLSARQLIPAQIQQAVAPIRAQNRFQLQSLRQEGANRVNEIEANTELQLAQMRASAQAERLRRRQTAAANAPTLTQSEMAAALETGAADILSNAQAQAQAIVERNRQSAVTDPRQGMATAAGLAAMYGYIPGEYQQPEQPPAPPPDAASAFEARLAATTQTPTVDTGALSQMYGAQPQPTVDTGALSQMYGAQPPQPTVDTGALSQMYGAQPQPQQPTGPAPPQTSRLDLIRGVQSATEAAQLSQQRYFSDQFGYLTMPQVERLAGRYGDLTGPLVEQAQQTPVTNPRDIAEIMGGQPVTTGYNTVGGTPILGVDENGQPAVVGYEPTSQIPNMEVMPSATETFRQAEELAATRLGKAGYSFGMPEVQLGMQANQGQTLANYAATQRGELPIAEQITAAKKEAEDAYALEVKNFNTQRSDLESAQGSYYAAGRRNAADIRSEASAGRAQESGGRAATAADRAAVNFDYSQAQRAQAGADAADKGDIYQLAGVGWVPSLGPLELVATKIRDPASGIVQMLQRFDSEVRSRQGEAGQDFVLDVDAIMDEIGIVDPLARRIIKTKYPG